MSILFTKSFVIHHARSKPSFQVGLLAFYAKASFVATCSTRYSSWFNKQLRASNKKASHQRGFFPSRKIIS
jgi:pyruvate/2-oxoacid:ferredoxin oxidoreductase beta subunit